MFNSFVSCSYHDSNDPVLGDYMTQLRRQAANRKLSSFETVGRGNPIVPVDVVPPINILNFNIFNKLL